MNMHAATASESSRTEAPQTRFAKDQLRAFVERIERLESDKKDIADDIKDVYGEAKGNGFDVKALRKLIARRKRDRDELAEEEAILATYMVALGMAPEFEPDNSPGSGTGGSRSRDTETRASPSQASTNTADERRARSKARTTESMADTAAFARELADAAAFARELADVARKFGNSPATTSSSAPDVAQSGEPATLRQPDLHPT